MSDGEPTVELRRLGGEMAGVNCLLVVEEIEDAAHDDELELPMPVSDHTDE